MPNAAVTPALAEFLAELEDAAEPEQTRRSAESLVFQGQRLNDFDRGLPGPGETGDGESTDQTLQHGVYDDDEDDEPRRFPFVRIALAAGGFLLMAAVGAMAAALVFHDRVARIMAR